MTKLKKSHIGNLIFKMENLKYTYEISKCDDFNPRTEYENLGTIAYKHNRYILGEEEIQDPIDWLSSKLNIDAEEFDKTNENLQKLEAIFFDKYIALPLYLYDHSGLSIKTTPFSCNFDSGKIGYIYISKDKMCEIDDVEFISDELKNKILKLFEAEIKMFDDYLSDNIYQIIIRDNNGTIIDNIEGINIVDINDICKYLTETKNLISYGMSSLDMLKIDIQNKIDNL